MALDRDSIIGKECEVDGCHSPCVDDETRCHDHSLNRLLEEAFDESERCSFGGTQCVIHATRVNQYGVLMCENCYRQWTRITAANLHVTSPYLMGERPFVQGNQQSMGAIHPPGTTYDGGSYHRNINWEALIESAREEGDEDND
tara:strand:- start:2204 stop:2635 length:432 start_codon:yes stop_codon:yes gene_type:complete